LAVYGEDLRGNGHVEYEQQSGSQQAGCRKVGLNSSSGDGGLRRLITEGEI